MITDISDLKAQIENECRFCNPSEKERILFQSDNFYVMVSLGPILEGYLLIVTKRHIGACLHIPYSLWNEFVGLKNKVKEILTRVYDGCIFYEHGKVGSSLTIGKDHRHCLHCHLHCIPANINMNEIVSAEMDGVEFDDFDFAYLYANANNIDRYLLIEDDVTKIYVPDFPIRKQFLRYKLAEALGKPSEWDWVNHQNWKVIHSSIERLKPFFNETSF